MKRFFLFLIFALVLLTSANSQWYKRIYGADSLKALTKSQLEESLKRETSHKTRDIVGAIVGTAAITVGVIMVNNASGSEDPEKILGQGLIGLILLPSGILILPTEIIIILIRNNRIRQIKEALNIPKVRLGVLNSPVNYLTRAYNNHPIIGVTVTFTF